MIVYAGLTYKQILRSIHSYDTIVQSSLYMSYKPIGIKMQDYDTIIANTSVSISPINQ